MARKQPFSLVYASRLKQQLKTIEAKYPALIHSTIEEQLLFEPDVPTTNRKPLREPMAFGAAWEIRFGPDNRFRVFYNIDLENREVRILAVGVKQGSRLLIEGEEDVEL